jgi:anti-sigma-K factor RskA
MIPERGDELNVLAGEYVLGVLEPDAAREVEAALDTNADLRLAVAFWEERLSPLMRTVPEAEPPSDMWARIAARIEDTSKPSSPRLWTSLVLWRSATALAATTAACLAVYIAATPTSSGPSFVAVLHAPQQDQPAWVATAGTNGLLVKAVAGNAAPGDRAFELWAIAPQSKPQSLGVIPSDGRLELGALPPAIRNGGTLAISIEPKSGSPTGQPTGPVVFVGALVEAQ